jgi:hypothetical protein
MNIYVGNLSWQMTDEDLRNLFEQHGTVASAKIVKDKVARDSDSSKWKTTAKPNKQSPTCTTARLWVARSSSMSPSPNNRVAAAAASRKEALAAAALVAAEVTRKVAITAVVAAVATTGIINLINQYIFVP